MISNESQDLNYWRISILGQKCEVFWSPPDDEETKKDVLFNNNDEFEADWYEAIVKRYDVKRNLYEVSFVGEEKRYFLTLNPTNTRACSFSSNSSDVDSLDQQQQHQNHHLHHHQRLESHFMVNHPERIVPSSSVLMENTTQTMTHRTIDNSIDLDTNWIQHVVGKEWEVFWQSNSTSHSHKANNDEHIHDKLSNNVDFQHHNGNDNDNDDEESFYSDWYDALILSFCPLTCAFQVSFVGDDEDEVHNMYLEPKDVRVAARSWVKRTIALLELNGSTVRNDDGTMKKEYEIDMILPPKCIPWNGNECIASNGTESDETYFDIMYYQQLLQDQLKSRSHLTFSLENEDESKNKNPEENSQQHIDYLVECIHLVLDVCQWYNENTPECFYNRFLKPSNQTSEMTDLYVCTIIGIMKLIKASSIDLRRTRKKQPSNKSTHTASNGSSNNLTFATTSRKRRKITSNKRFDIYQSDNMGTSSDKIMISFDIEDLNIDNLTNNLTACRNLWNQMIRSAGQTDNVRVGISNLTKDSLCSVLSGYIKHSNSYFNQVISDGVIQHHIRCWDNLTQWKQAARSVLGPKYTPQDNLLDVIESNDDFCTSFTLPDMQKCLSASKSGDIQKFNMSCYIDALNQKMMDVFRFQIYAWDILAKVEHTEIDASTNDDTDVIVRDLEKLKESPLCPDDSKNAKEEMTEFDLCVDLNASTIEKAIILRRWMLRCHRACSHRERVNEYTKLSEIYPGTFRIPSKAVEKLGLKTASILNKLVSHLQSIQKKITETTGSGNINVDSQDELIELKCGGEFFITESEEKCAIVRSIKKWQTQVEGSGAMDGGVRVSIQVIDSLFQDLSSLQDGICEDRIMLVNDLSHYQHIDQIMAEFSKQYISQNAFMHRDRIISLNESSKSWMRKSDHVMNILMNQGNDTIVNMSGTPVKGKQYVDLKYIEDLIQEHEMAIFTVSPNIKVLKEVANSCKMWMSQLANNVPEMPQEDQMFSNPPLKQLENLQMLSKSRPKGINMHPSKQTLSKWIDFLIWYGDCTNALEHISELHVKKTEELGESAHIDVMKLAKGNALIESLIFKGYEIISFFSSVFDLKSNTKHFKIIFSAHEHSFFENYLKKRLDKTLHTNRFSPDDIKNSNGIILNMIRYDESLASHGVLFKLQLYLWKTLAAFIMTQMGEKRKSSSQGNFFQPTLETATSILSHLENFPTIFQDLQCSDPFIKSLYSSRIEPLYHLVTEAAELESHSQNLLSYIDVFVGDITIEWIAKSLDDLKSMKRKVRSINEFGLSINSIYLTKIDKRIRDINWLSNAENATKNISHNDKSQTRVSFQLLHSMIEKVPSQCKRIENSEYFSLSSKLHSTYRRLKKWHDDCLKWLEEVKEFLPKSATKGTKQREIRSVYLLNESIDKYAVVSEKVIENLLVSDILKFVEMKEEKAVQESYRRTLELKQKMYEIFGIDHVGNDVDRTTLPDYDSLLGIDGTFYIKRLTGSPEFQKLRDNIDDVASSAEDLPVKTLEKITYDWICDALLWISKVSTSLKDPTDEQSPFHKIYLSSKDTEELVKESTELFFVALTDDIKKYLSAHKVCISPRSGSGRVHVKSNKGGSIHSIGGTVLRWIAFMFNALQQDLIVSSQWAKLAKGYMAKPYSQDNENTLRTLFDQMQDLVVAPEEEIVFQLLKRLQINNSSESADNNPNTVFVHQLLGDS